MINYDYLQFNFIEIIFDDVYNFELVGEHTQTNEFVRVILELDKLGMNRLFFNESESEPVVTVADTSELTISQNSYTDMRGEHLLFSTFDVTIGNPDLDYENITETSYDVLNQTIEVEANVGSDGSVQIPRTCLEDDQGDEVTSTYRLDNSTGDVPDLVTLNSQTGELTYDAPDVHGTFTFNVIEEASNGFSFSREVTILTVGELEEEDDDTDDDDTDDDDTDDDDNDDTDDTGDDVTDDTGDDVIDDQTDDDEQVDDTDDDPVDQTDDTTDTQTEETGHKNYYCLSAKDTKECGWFIAAVSIGCITFVASFSVSAVIVYTYYTSSSTSAAAGAGSKVTPSNNGGTESVPNEFDTENGDTIMTTQRNMLSGSLPQLNLRAQADL